MFQFLNRFFHLEENSTTVKRELLAGATTFFTLAYAIILIPSLLAEAGLDLNAALVATTLTAVYATLLMGLLANYPFVLAPGVALCVYFTYSVVLAERTTWQTALGIIFMTGLILMILNLTRIRQLIIQVIPLSLRLATTAGLGLFLALIGLRNAEIIEIQSTGFSFGDPATLKHLLTAIGLISMGVMMVLGIPGSVFIGILIVWLLSLSVGLVEWHGLVALPSSIAPTFLQLDIPSVFRPQNVSILISFVFVALFDSTGTLIGLAHEAGFLKESYDDKKRFTFPRVTKSLIPDTTGTILAPLLGSTAVAVYLESAAGIGVGGKTGLTAVTAGILFLISLFFAPLAASIPLFATAPALIIVGALMLKNIQQLDWKDPSEWIPAFMTVILIPLTGSIANGIAVGYITYCFIKLLSAKTKDVHWFSWILGILFLLKFIYFPTD